MIQSGGLGGVGGRGLFRWGDHSSRMGGYPWEWGGFPWGWNDWSWPYGEDGPSSFRADWQYPEVWGTGPWYYDWPFDPNYGYPPALPFAHTGLFDPMLGYPVLPPWVV
jgi:hypothetical protein